MRPEPKQFSKDLHTAEELVLEEKDEDYISSLIMTEEEVRHKAMLWNKINAGYLREQKSKYFFALALNQCGVAIKLSVIKSTELLNN